METKTPKSKKVTKKDEKSSSKTHPLIIGQRITEKSAIHADKGAYTFNVVASANKNEIKKAVKMLYNVTPVKVSVTTITPKKVVRRGIVGTKQGGKKAVVYLKKGDKITFA